MSSNLLLIQLVLLESNPQITLHVALNLAVLETVLPLLSLPMLILLDSVAALASLVLALNMDLHANWLKISPFV
jgi:hypothetical protein